MTNADLKKFVEFYPNLKTLTGKKFSLAVIKNLRKAKEILGDIEKLREPSEDWVKIEEKIREKGRQLSTKDANGNPLTKKDISYDGQVVAAFLLSKQATKEREEFIEGLREQSREVFEKRHEQIRQYLEAMGDPCLDDFIMISDDDLPDDVSVEAISVLGFMIE